ncbi:MULTISPECIES: glycine cleavage system protein GcvH [Antrihabitans]|uniref:Glycine cleavage system H protein n=2 Tax=Antrihabitans TaxID=2799491 RepID=A0A934U282_9NOCA|nr:glycine cleavage system protein GcvH [Antrihabitans stalagmiti]MBJ8337998.1 glycine cleavage system protein GcvH [Antrihabitans stalagmiti]
MSDSETPADLRYTEEHEWVKRTGPTTVRIGITDYAQSQLGDVVFVQLPAIDDEVVGGDSFGEIESTKSVSDIFAPMTAKVVAVNEDLESAPETVNSDPYGDGWLAELEVADEKTLDIALKDTLDAEGYLAVVGD